MKKLYKTSADYIFSILFFAVMIIIFLAATIGVFISLPQKPQSAYIITSQGHEFETDEFKQSKDCIEFLHQGETVTACGDYQIKSNRGGAQSE